MFAMGCERSSSRAVARTNGRADALGVKVSTDSMRPEAFAASRVNPFPCDTAIDRELGRHTIATGIPRRSSPVMFAMRVMPMVGMRGRTRPEFQAGATERWVPVRARFTACVCRRGRAPRLQRYLRVAAVPGREVRVYAGPPVKRGDVHSSVCACRSGTSRLQLIEYPFGLDEVNGVKPLVKPRADRRQESVGPVGPAPPRF